VPGRVDDDQAHTILHHLVNHLRDCTKEVIKKRRMKKIVVIMTAGILAFPGLILAGEQRMDAPAASTVKSSKSNSSDRFMKIEADSEKAANLNSSKSNRTQPDKPPTPSTNLNSSRSN